MRLMNQLILAFCLIAHVGLQGADSKIILMRHGESDHNLKDVYNSDPSHAAYTPSHLTESGKAQAAATADRLKKEGFNSDTVCAVYVSPLPRTQETAQILVSAGVISEDKVTIEPLVTETKAGDLEGKPIIRPWTDADSEKYHSETEEQMRIRIRQFLDKLRSHPECTSVLVVTHNIPAQVIMKMIGVESKKLEPGEAIVLWMD